jgi:hypothetical protein
MNTGMRVVPCGLVVVVHRVVVVFRGLIHVVVISVVRSKVLVVVSSLLVVVSSLVVVFSNIAVVGREMSMLVV